MAASDSGEVNGFDISIELADFNFSVFEDPDEDNQGVENVLVLMHTGFWHFYVLAQTFGNSHNFPETVIKENMKFSKLKTFPNSGKIVSRVIGHFYLMLFDVRLSSDGQMTCVPSGQTEAFIPSASADSNTGTHYFRDVIFFSPSIQEAHPNLQVCRGKIGIVSITQNGFKPSSSNPFENYPLLSGTAPPGQKPPALEHRIASVRTSDTVREHTLDYTIPYFNGIDRRGIKHWNTPGDRIHFRTVYPVDSNGPGEVGGYLGYMSLAESFENGNTQQLSVDYIMTMFYAGFAKRPEIRGVDLWKLIIDLRFDPSFPVYPSPETVFMFCDRKEVNERLRDELVLMVKQYDETPPPIKDDPNMKNEPIEKHLGFRTLFAMAIDIVAYMLTALPLSTPYMEDSEIFPGDMADKIRKGHAKERWMFSSEKIRERFYDEMTWGREPPREGAWDYNVKNDPSHGLPPEVTELIDDYSERERDYEEEYGMPPEGAKGAPKARVYHDPATAIMERIGDITLGCGSDCEDMAIYSAALAARISNHRLTAETAKSDEEKIVVCLKQVFRRFIPCTSDVLCKDTSGKELYHMVCVLVPRVILGSWVDIGNGFARGSVMRKTMINPMTVRGTRISEPPAMYGTKDLSPWEMVHGYTGPYICEGTFFHSPRLFHFSEQDLIKKNRYQMMNKYRHHGYIQQRFDSKQDRSYLPLVANRIMGEQIWNFWGLGTVDQEPPTAAGDIPFYQTFLGVEIAPKSLGELNQSTFNLFDAKIANARFEKPDEFPDKDPKTDAGKTKGVSAHEFFNPDTNSFTCGVSSVDSLWDGQGQNANMATFKKFMETFHAPVGFVHEDVREPGTYERSRLLRLFSPKIIEGKVDANDPALEIDDEVNGLRRNTWPVLIREFVGKMEENKDLNFLLSKRAPNSDFALKDGKAKRYENRYETFQIQYADLADEKFQEAAVDFFWGYVRSFRLTDPEEYPRYGAMEIRVHPLDYRKIIPTRDREVVDGRMYQFLIQLYY